VGEAILGANVFRDIFAGITDIIGGRSGAYEEELGKANMPVGANALEEMDGLGSGTPTTIKLAFLPECRGGRRSGLRSPARPSTTC
jgi:hypothetical protein